MNTNTLTLASGLSDSDLLARIVALAGKEREASVELVAHLAVLDVRPSLFASQACGSLFGYCTKVLRLSEDAACSRIEAARACRGFPVILDHLASGALSLTAVRLLRRHLTPANHEAVLARACGRSRREIEALVAELAPRPDVPSSVRKLPNRHGRPCAQNNARYSAAGDTCRGRDRCAPRTAATVHSATVHPTAGRSDTTSDHRDHLAGALSHPVHDRQGEPREASARSGSSPSRDPERRPGRHLRPRPHPAPGEGRENQAGGGKEAAAASPYPSRDG